jgi:hypothetical protein
MFELIIVLFFIWILINSIGLAFRLSWGIAKLCAGILMVLALPVLVLCLIFAGGILLLIPVAMVCIAAGILKTCLDL